MVICVCPTNRDLHMIISYVTTLPDRNFTYDIGITFKKKKRSIRDRVILTTAGRQSPQKRNDRGPPTNHHLHMIIWCETLLMICKFCIRWRHNPWTLEEINERSCNPYNEWHLRWHAIFAYDGGATLPKTRDSHVILTMAGPQPTYKNKKNDTKTVCFMI